MSEWITTAEAAKISGYHVEHIRRLIRQGKLNADKKGRDWWVDKQALISFMEAIVQAEDIRRGPKNIKNLPCK